MALLFINILLTLFSFNFTHRLLNLLSDSRKIKVGNLWLNGVALFLCLAINLIPAAFTGMEHSPHICLTLILITGLALTEKRGQMPFWLPLVIILLPLVRYEALAISGLALLYLAHKRYWLITALSGLSIALLVLGFSLFLHNQGLGYLPSSIITKSGHTSLSISSHGFLDALFANLLHPGGIYCLLMIIILFTDLQKRAWPRGIFSTQTILGFAAIAHLVFGRFGWFGRYELYINLPLTIYGVIILWPRLLLWLAKKILPEARCHSSCFSDFMESVFVSANFYTQRLSEYL